jgi:hypothetical protein
LVLQEEPQLDSGGHPINTHDALLEYIVSKTRRMTVCAQSDLLIPTGPPLIDWSFSSTFARQAGLLKPVEGSMQEIEGGQQLAIGQPVAVSGRRLRLQVTKGSQASLVPDAGSGSLQVTDLQVFLIDAFPPDVDYSSESSQVWRVITTSGFAGSLHTAGGNITLFSSDKNDPIVGEAAVISAASVAGPITILSFEQALSRIYDRTTVAVNANVVEATHGETMHEILGSGDATNAALQFTLKQTPLTYVSAPSGLGASSTLEVWVNNLRWPEVDDFLEATSTDRVFVTRRKDDGKVVVQFGDGRQGARPPTGAMNLRAVYRRGIGASGMVRAGQLSQPIDRPQGLKSVTNPDPATGGADPDSAEDARASAPLHVLTLGRVVSLEDYQNFSRAFAGIEKALATWTWLGRTRGVFLTVAGANGSGFQAGDPTIVNLASALRSAGHPYLPLHVASYQPILFEIGANVRVDVEDYDPVQVLEQVWQSLSSAFSFDHRQLGQGVAQSEIIALIQQTTGVIAVELTAFNRQGEAAGTPLAPVLRAASPRAGQDGKPEPAEMLLLDPGSKGQIGVWS